jgi:putative transposase
MKIRKAYKFRIYPNQTQMKALSKQFGIVRFVYNHFLDQRITTYRETGKGLNYYDIARQLTELKSQEETSWLKEGDSQAMQQGLKDQERAFQNFFSKRSGYPKFKSRKGKQSIRYPQRVKVNLGTKRTYLPKVGWIKTRFHQEIEGVVKNVTVSKTKSGKYFASFQIEMEKEEPEYKGKENGIDFGIQTFVVLSDGQTYENSRHLQKKEKQLRRYQRKLSRRKQGSQRWQKQKQKVAILHEVVQNTRLDHHHKLSRALVDEHSLLAVEDLHIKGMVRNKRLAKHIQDASWGEFVRQLKYKGEWYGCHTQTIDRWYPSSKTCSECGYVMKEMPLNVRVWKCPHCQIEHNRDVNAAKNILKQTTVGATGSNASGVQVRPEVQYIGTQAGTSKLETPQLAVG